MDILEDNKVLRINPSDNYHTDMKETLIFKITDRKINFKENSFKYQSILKHKGNTYYIYQDIPGIFLSREVAKKPFKYYMAIKINILNDYIEVYRNSVVILEMNCYEIKGIISENYFCMNDAIEDMKRDMFYSLMGIIDYKSREGKAVLFKNLPDSTSSWVNNKVMRPPSYRFKRKTKSSRCDYIDLKKVVGTQHKRYVGNTWLEMFYDLKREGNLIKAVMFPEYYSGLQGRDGEKNQISYIKFDDELYISSGNHRTLLLKLKGFDYIYAPLTEYKTDLEYELYYNKLKEQGCIISLPVEEQIYERGIDYGVEEDWEVFSVFYKGKSTKLIGISEIKDFYNYIQSNFCTKAYIRFRNIVRNKRINSY